jgi:succinate dehydrogenase / fumarate reductase, cytochrome b subunit
MQTRPVNLNLFTIRFPMTAIASILHRVSGVLLFLFIPFVLCGLQQSLTSEEGFAIVVGYCSTAIARFFIWAGLSALLFHLVAGLRHLVMDCGFFESKSAGKYTSIMVLVVTGISILGLGYCLW